jgi:SAM-dependent methyltransferase
MLEKIRFFLKGELFSPGFFGILINPFYFARKGLVKSISEFSNELSGSLLDVGCGTMPYKKLFNVTKYTGLDLDSSHARKFCDADFYYDGHTFPFEDGTFNSVLCNQVLEHVFNPDKFLLEINRVVIEGGILLLTVPFVWDEHEQPHDYARYTSFGLHALLIKNGFVILSHRKIGDDFSTICQLINVYLYKICQSWPKPFRLMFTMTIMASINLIGIILSKVLPKNPDLFLDQIILAKKDSHF